MIGRQMQPQLQADDESEEPMSAHDRLRAVDPISAEKLHANDIRKIERSLELFRQTGMPPSELLSQAGSRAAYRCAILWLDADDSVLDQRLDTRIEQMVRSGVVTEVRTSEFILYRKSWLS